MENMKTNTYFESGTREKHNLDGNVITLLDKRHRILWTSDDPLNTRGGVGLAPSDLYAEDVRNEITAITGRCFVGGETVGYVSESGPWPPGSSKVHLWRVTMLPVDSQAMPNTAGVVMGTILPDSYPEINDDEKQVLSSLADDYSLKEIAAMMHRSESAIDSKIKSLKMKLGCKTIGGLVAKAVRQSVI